MKTKTAHKLLIGIGIGVVALIIMLAFAFPYMTMDTATVTVSEKERITTGSGGDISSKFLVYCDGEVFENSDSLAVWKWGSADLQNELKVGQTYKVKVYGWRVPMLSWFRNIVEVE